MCLGTGVHAAPPLAMAFTFAAFCYMLSLVLCAALIFFAIWHVSNRQRLLTLLFRPVHPLLPGLLSSAPDVARAADPEASRRAPAGCTLGRPRPEPGDS